LLNECELRKASKRARLSKAFVQNIPTIKVPKEDAPDELEDVFCFRTDQFPYRVGTVRSFNNVSKRTDLMTPSTQLWANQGEKFYGFGVGKHRSKTGVEELSQKRLINIPVLEETLAEHEKDDIGVDGEGVAAAGATTLHGSDDVAAYVASTSTGYDPLGCASASRIRRKSGTGSFLEDMLSGPAATNQASSKAGVTPQKRLKVEGKVGATGQQSLGEESTRDDASIDGSDLGSASVLDLVAGHGYGRLANICSLTCLNSRPMHSSSQCFKMPGPQRRLIVSIFGVLPRDGGGHVYVGGFG
jgi:hypothetical protein